MKLPLLRRPQISKSSLASLILLVFAILPMLLFFQNCNQGFQAEKVATLPSRNAICFFNGLTVNEGQAITGFLNSSAPFGQNCMSENRTCTNGALSGSYNYGACVVQAAAACLFNGQTVNHDQSVVAFQNSSVAFGQTCMQEVRTCNNGTLSGQYNFNSCAVNTPANCLINGTNVSHNASVVAYQNSTVPFGQTCVQENRLCNNGVASGSFAFSSCAVDGPAGCLFNGRTLANGETTVAFQNSTVPFGQSCIQESRTCTNGVLSGSYNFATCQPDVAKSCLFNGRTLAHNEVVTAFQTSSVVFGQACVAETRLCQNGTLNGSYNFASCVPDAPLACLFDGKTIVHNQAVTAFQSSTVPFGQNCTSQLRTCNNGTLSGTFSFATCAPDAPASCIFDGKSIAHNQVVMAYAVNSVAYNQLCPAPQARTCSNGVLSGTGAYSSCAVTPGLSCNFNGQSIPHGNQVKAYFQNSNSFSNGYLCDVNSEMRNCQNGFLSGSFSFSSCAIAAPKNCSLKDGTPVIHGASSPTFSQQIADNGIFCSPQILYCYDGMGSATPNTVGFIDLATKFNSCTCSGNLTVLSTGYCGCASTSANSITFGSRYNTTTKMCDPIVHSWISYSTVANQDYDISVTCPGKVVTVTPGLMDKFYNGTSITNAMATTTFPPESNPYPYLYVTLGGTCGAQMTVNDFTNTSVSPAIPYKYGPGCVITRKKCSVTNFRMQ